MPISSRWFGYIFFAVLLFMLFALASYAYLGAFTRYMADDYCTAATVRTMDFWTAQSHWWNNWSGRFSFTFVILFVELFGVDVVPILPALIILLWTFGIVWVCVPFLKSLKAANYISSAVFIASSTLWLTYRSLNDYPQVVFWQTGILTYPITPILFLLGTGLAIRRATNPTRLSWLEMLCWFLYAFGAGGFSETGVVMQAALIFVLLVFVRASKFVQKSTLTAILVVTLIGSVLALLTMALAPGTAVRSNGFSAVPALKTSIPGLIRDALLFIPRLVDEQTIPILFGFLAGIFLIYFCIPEEIQFDNQSIGKHLVGSALFVEIGILSGIAPAYILRGVLPPERVLLFSYFLVACLLVYWGALSAIFVRLNLPVETRFFQVSISLGLLVVFIAWSVMPDLVSRLQLIPSLQTYSAVWDQRHQSLLMMSQNDTTILVAKDFMKIEAFHKLRTKLWVTGDFETSSDYWINLCGAAYYGVDQVIAE